jgi:hypothetical protein
MLSHAPRLVGRRKFGRAGVVQQQEGTELFAVAVVRKNRAYRKAIPDPMRARWAVNTEYSFHDRLLVTSPVASMKKA